MEATALKGNHGANVRRWREWRNIRTSPQRINA